MLGGAALQVPGCDKRPAYRGGLAGKVMP